MTGQGRLLVATAVLICAVSVGHTASLRRQLHAARRSALTDPLTGLANRAGLRTEFEQLVVAATPDTVIGVMLVDLDGFKQINDAYGHDVGDQVLVRVARRLARQCLDGQVCVASRLGGDEFVVLGTSRLLEELHGLPLAVLASVEHLVSLGSLTLRPRASVGLAHAPASSANLGELLAEADTAMYRAKRSGERTGRYLEAIDGPPMRASRPRVRTRDCHPTTFSTSEVTPSP